MRKNPTEKEVEEYKKDARENVEIDAKCMDDRQPAFGITNLGQLIPCCWCDTAYNRQDMNYQKLLMASNISDYDTIDEILTTDEWIDFYEGLKENRGFAACYHVCRKRSTPQHKREVILNRKKDGKDFVRST